MMPSTRTRRASRSKSTSPSIPRLRNNSKRSILCLTTVVLLVQVWHFRSRTTRWLAFGYTDSFTPPPGTLLTTIGPESPKGLLHHGFRHHRRVYKLTSTQALASPLRSTAEPHYPFNDCPFLHRHLLPTHEKIHHFRKTQSATDLPMRVMQIVIRRDGINIPASFYHGRTWQHQWVHGNIPNLRNITWG